MPTSTNSGPAVIYMFRRRSPAGFEYSRDTLLTPEPAKDVRLYRLASFFRQRYGEIFDRTMGSLDRMRRRLAISATLASVLVGMATGAVYLYVIWLIVNGEGSIRRSGALRRGCTVLLQATLPMLGFDVGYLSTLAFDFLAQPVSSDRNAARPGGPRESDPCAEAYPGRDSIRAGFLFISGETPDRFFTTCLSPSGGTECLALVGHNGAGKTTIVKLLLRLYDPSAGRILLDGVDLTRVRPGRPAPRDRRSLSGLRPLRADRRRKHRSWRCSSDQGFASSIRAAASKAGAVRASGESARRAGHLDRSGSSAVESFPAASGRSSPLPARSCAIASCLFSMSRLQTWMSRPSMKSTSVSTS